MCFCRVHGQPRCKIEHYSTEDGLSHDMVTSMYKDKEGFMWLGTWNGLNRFDGRQFLSFKSAPGDSSYIKNNRIDQVTGDDYHHLWVKSYDGQIYRFDKTTERFRPAMALLRNPPAIGSFKGVLSQYDDKLWMETIEQGILLMEKPASDSSSWHWYTQQAAEQFRIPSNKVLFMKEDRQGQVWLGTDKGLCRLVKNKAGVYESMRCRYACDTAAVTCMAETAEAVYAGTDDGRLLVIAHSGQLLTSFHLGNAALYGLLVNRNQKYLYATTGAGALVRITLRTWEIQQFMQDSKNALYSLYEDRRGDLWIKPEKEGVIVFHVQRQQFKNYFQQNNARYNYAGDHFKVYEDKNGILWVNMKGGGFGYYNAEKDAVEYFYNNPLSGTRRMSNIVSTLFYDTDGLLWLRTDERGIEKIIFQPEDFQQRLLVQGSVYRSDNEVRGLLEDRRHRLWLGMKSGLLYILENGKPAGVRFENMPGHGIGQVYTILQDKAGCMWLGTKAHGLYKATPVNAPETVYRLEHFMPDAADATSISSNEIYTLLEDSRGLLWAGSFQNGLNLVQNDNGHTRFIHDRECLANYPAGRYRKIRHMAEDKNGRLWMATTDGLLIADVTTPASFTYASYQKISGDGHSLGNNNVQYICRDTHDQMWLATLGGGLNKAIGDDPLRSLRFDVYTMKQGLPNDYLLSCAEDSYGYLWIATQTGLSRLDKTTMKFRNYNSNDGLPLCTFSEASCQLCDNGHMVFGTIRGLVEVDPPHLKDHVTDMQLAFTGLSVNNETVLPGTGNPVMPVALNYTKEVTLHYDQNTLGFDFTIPDFRLGSKQAYAYRLQGFEDRWNYTSEGSATYTHLPPGRYVLEVKCMHTALYQQVPYRQLAVTILPPLWKTGWAYLLYSVLIMSLGWALWKTAATLLRLKQRIALEKKVAALKLDFFTNVSHELRTPLTLIMNPVAALEQREGLSQLGKQYVEVIKRNANRMNRFINQLLELRKLESGKAQLQVAQVALPEFVKNITSFFLEMIREKQIHLEIIADVGSLYCWCDKDKMETAFYNVLANACKYTRECGHIVIRLQQQEQNMLIEVMDEGGGVEEGELPYLFDLFYAGKGSHKTGVKGTGIGLALTREIIELHGGSITACNRGGGLAVTIMLPIVVAASKKAGISYVQEPAEMHDNAIPDIVADPLLHEPAAQGQGRHPEQPLLLIVEDNSDLRAFIQSLLSPFYRIALAENGREGCRIALELMPDLVISDIMMPEMDGIQMLDYLKKNMVTSHIPVILLTAKSAVESQIEGLEYGADYYIGKPFQNDFLMAAIRSLVRQRKLMLKHLVNGKENIRLEPGTLQVTSQDAKFLKQVTEVVEEKMADESFDIDTVAVSIGMGRTTFYKKFKGLTGMAPVEFVREMRLKRAQQYFDAGYGNVSEVAYAVGFNNAKYFSTCFKARYQVAPTEYLKQHQSGNLAAGES
ncbi:DNA-binding response regulator, AraC family [Filimonas lacunae]|nr:DNA-binding response regulator, AraC family [Filimonas lacunae]